MADATSNFNMESFINNYQKWNDMKFTAAENAQQHMNAEDEKRAEEAVKQGGFFGALTIGKKLEEAGIGKRVMEQIGETAAGIVTGAIRPLTKYLEEVEVVINQDEYKQKFQEFAKQMYYSKEELSKAASFGVYVNGLTNTRDGQTVDENGEVKLLGITTTGTKFNAQF